MFIKYITKAISNGSVEDLWGKIQIQIAILITLFIHLKTERQKLQMNKGTPEMTLYCKIS